MSDADDTEALLAQVEAQVAELEARAQVVTPAVEDARHRLEVLRRRRQLVQRQGVRVMGAEARSAARTVVTAVGCAAVIAGAHALDSSYGPPALVLAFLLLVVEGSR